MNKIKKNLKTFYSICLLRNYPYHASYIYLDLQLNYTKRSITGAMRSTPLPCLPVCSDIPPPNLRRCQALLQLHNMICSNQQLPIHNIQDLEMKSRRPSIKMAGRLKSENFCLTDKWSDETVPVISDTLRKCTRPLRFDLPWLVIG